MLRLALLFLLPLVSSTDIRAYTVARCGGTQWICTSIPAGSCCNFPVEIASMVWDVPDVIGQTSTHRFHNCQYPLSSRQYAHWDMCFSYTSPTKAQSASWKLTDTPAPKCTAGVEPDVVIYERPEGGRRMIDVPVGWARTVAEEVRKKDWTGLATWEESRKNIRMPAITIYVDIAG